MYEKEEVAFRRRLSRGARQPRFASGGDGARAGRRRSVSQRAAPPACCGRSCLHPATREASGEKYRARAAAHAQLLCAARLQDERRPIAQGTQIVEPIEDPDAIGAVINDAALAYRGVIPADRWHDPYMPREELVSEMLAGVKFFSLRR